MQNKKSTNSIDASRAERDISDQIGYDLNARIYTIDVFLGVDFH